MKLCFLLLQSFQNIESFWSKDIKFFPSEGQPPPPPSRLCAQSARYSLQIYFQIKDSKSGKLCVFDICTCICQVLTVVASKSEVL